MAEKVFISGRMTGLTDEEIAANFETARKKLESEGFTVVSPLKNREIVTGGDLSWDELLEIALAELGVCDAIYMLKNWRGSRGAKRELAYARSREMRILFE